MGKDISIQYNYQLVTHTFFATTVEGSGAKQSQGGSSGGGVAPPLPTPASAPGGAPGNGNSGSSGGGPPPPDFAKQFVPMTLYVSVCLHVHNYYTRL